MAKLTVDGADLVVELSRWERLGSLRRSDLRVPLSAVRAVSLAPKPFAGLRGMRFPGTGWPGLIALGTWVHDGGKDFAACYRNRNPLIIELEGVAFKRFVICAQAPAELGPYLNLAQP